MEVELPISSMSPIYTGQLVRSATLVNVRLIKVSVLLVALVWVPPSDAQDNAQEEEVVVDDGAPNCISSRRIRRIRIIDDQNVLIYLSAQTIYHNQFRNPCTGLERRRTFSYNSNDGLLCEGDGIAALAGEVWGAARPVPSCWLGPHRKISKEEADAMRDAKKNPPKIEAKPLPMPEPSEVTVKGEDTES